MKIQVILGSTRPGRISERVAKWVVAQAQTVPDFEVELVDLADYDLPFFNEPVPPRYNPNRQPGEVTIAWMKKLSEADGYVVVTPEYNHLMPAVLKNSFDFLTNEMTKKPVAIVSFGAGTGGARAAEELKLLITQTNAAIVPEAIAISGAAESLDENGNWIGDTSNPYGPHAAIAGTLNELKWWTKTLKAGRDIT